ncbi:regulator of complement activation group 2 gene 1 [Pseudorasbora parva]|uniref:regulator of complement activation group 2 gene 1 n=1 Tax=Pseudorasbora parva TaxID=51549 RepID=UPI00351E64C9
MGFNLQYLCAAAFFLCLMKAVNIRAQCQQPSFPSKNVILSNSYLSTESFPDGSTVTFECIIGHKPVKSRASKSVTCQGTQWTSLELDCTRKSCGSPPDFLNGRYEKTGILFGDKITAVCDKGFVLAGQIKDRWCRDGGWDGRDPVCEAEKCQAPPIIENGQIESVSYKCNSGFFLTGSSLLYRSEDGIFEPDPPKCLAQCQQPSFPSKNVILSDSYLSTESFPDGSTVTFECIIGHKPVKSRASKSVTCQGTQWTSLELDCTRKSCGSPPDFLNGRYEKTGILFGDKITAVCDKGFVLAGQIKDRWCRDGGWDGRDPVCEAEKCQAPPIIENGQIESVSYKCNSGFFLTGSSLLYRSEDGIFEPDPPKCLDGCPTPGIPHAIRIGGKSPPYKLGNFIDYKCEDGYIMKGESHIVCSANGWSPEPPQCIDKTEIMICSTATDTNVPAGSCSLSGNLENLIHLEKTNNLGLDLTFTDVNNMGFKVLSLSVALLSYLMICQHVRAQCEQPSFPSKNVILSDSYLSTQSFRDGSTVTFECIIGHKPVNSRASKSVTCQGTQWTSLALDCTRKSCGSPPDFYNGRYEKTGILFGDKITAVCDKGYILDGSMKDRWCRDGGWDGRDPVCEAVKCAAPPAIENGQLEEDLESYDYGQVVTYQCNAGLSLNGKAELHCSDDGTFKPDPPKCLDGCQNPEILHAVRTGGKSPPYKLGNFIDYKCEDGYAMKGESHIVCSANGWSPEPPQCIAVKCAEPPTIENGQLKEEPLESYNHGQVVTYQCNAGLSLSGNAELHCSGDGTFKPDPPKCLALPTTTTATIVTPDASPKDNALPTTTTATIVTPDASPKDNALPTTTTATIVTPDASPKDNEKSPSSNPALSICLVLLVLVVCAAIIVGIVYWKCFRSKHQYSNKVAKKEDEL